MHSQRQAKKDKKKEHRNYKKSEQQQGGISKNFVVAQSLSRVRLFQTPRTAAHQASLSFTISLSLLKLMSIELVMPSNRLVLSQPIVLLFLVFPSIQVFSNESALPIRWPKY